jgi:ABC-type bacteriocin/lantibiotic exporter with double-glycine peptidase domain
VADRRSPIDEAVDRLSSVERRGWARVPRRADPVADAVALAASAVGAATHPANPAATADLDPVDAAVASSGLMAWRVRLGGQWWRSLTSPLVVETPAGPGAVVPGDRGHDLLDAATRRARRLDRRAAGEVGSTATAIARDLPADPRWWRLLAWSLGRHRGDVWTLLGLGLVGGAAGLLLPLSTSAIFESAVPAGDLPRVAAILVVLALGSIGAGMLSLARGLLVVRIRDRSDAVLAPAVVAHLLRLRAAFFRARTTGDVVNRALSVDAARAQVDDGLFAAILTSAFGLANLAYLFGVEAALGIVGGLATVCALGLTMAIHLRSRALLPELLEARSRSDATLLGLMQSLISWRVAGAEGRALAHWAERQGASTAAFGARLRAISLTGPIDAAAPLFVLVAFVAAVILLPGERLRPGTAWAPGTFLALYAAVAQLAIAMTALGSQLVSLSELGPLLARLRPVVTEARERPAAAQPPGRLTGEVALARVVFGYRHDQAPLIDGLSLTVRPGELVAIVGPSGGGKSTVMRLLLGFEEPWAGSVTYDGRDLAGLDPAAVRRQLGVVLQASRPLGPTVRECVTGQRRMSDGDVWALLEEAGLGDDVRRMADRLDAQVGDHGMRLSGGQRQRLMIAAALAGRPRILLLDEATSALDNITQSVVMRTILAVTATRIVVAHRMSTVRDADRVFVIAGGGIVEEGTPAQLIALGGHFARLATRQEV